MKKFNSLILITLLLIIGSFGFAVSPLQQYVCVVSGNLAESTESFLKDYSDVLESKGYSKYAEQIDSYLEGSFGSGFVYYANGKPYVITNRHVVSNAETVNIKFENEDGSTSEYNELKIVAIDEDIDVALIELPSAFKKPGLILSDANLYDGDDIWSAGFPGLGGQPMWQLGKGVVTNSSARIKELISPDISTIIQHSANIDGGNSGGPLLVKDSNYKAGYRVVGINTWKAAYRESTNFAIPATVVKKFADKASVNSNNGVSIDTRIKNFVKDLADEDLLFAALGKYVSNEMISKSGGDAFINVLNKAPSTIRALIIALFDYDPIEALRYSITYEVWKEFQGKDGFLKTEASEITDSVNGKTVTLTPEGEKGIDVLWSSEQGNWRILEVSTIQKSSSTKKASSLKTSSSSTDSSSFGFNETNLIKFTGGLLMTPGDDRIGSSFEFRILLNNFALGLFVQNTKTNLIHENKLHKDEPMTSVGPTACLQFPIRMGRFMITPYGEIRLGFANFGKETTCFFTAIGCGVGFSFSINDMISPIIEVKYLNSRYDNSEKNQINSLGITAGVKLLPRS